jgi:DNA repair exonuclease SbcCD nuclease subunit
VLVINDLHIGVNRTGGTTPQSQAALRDYLRNGLEQLINNEDQFVIINGDLFDSFTVDTMEVMKTAVILLKWLSKSDSRALNLVAGNHDWQPRADRLSGFHLLTYMLSFSEYEHQVLVHDEGLELVGHTVWCIPHMPNQDLFNAEVVKASEMDGKGKKLLLHCNYKNAFTESSDHSLNLNDDQVNSLMTAGWTLVFGHEHVGRSLREGRVVIVGNQFPSSVSDCIGDDDKHCLRIHDGLHLERTWSAYENYVEVDWKDLKVSDKYKFIRVTGEASAAEAADVIKAVSKLRQSHEAFVITNAVKIEGCDLSEELASSVEDIKVFDVVGAIMGELTEQEQGVVKGLLND